MAPRAGRGAALWLSAALLALGRDASGCGEVPWYRGQLDPAAAAVGWTVTGPADGSCRCCALCHQQPNCKSLTFAPASGECFLYDQIASYATFQRSAVSNPDAPHYFLMPGVSERGQFCLDQSDCTDSGLSCTAHVCTDDPTVTCKDIATAAGAAATNGIFWGSVQGQNTMFYCWNDGAWGPGLTMLLSNVQTFVGWSDANWLNRSVLDGATNLLVTPYSSLGHAHAIRDSGDVGADFQIGLIGSYQRVGLVGVEMTLGRSASLTGGAPQDPGLISSRRQYGSNSFAISGSVPSSLLGAVLTAVLAPPSSYPVEGEMTVPYHHGSDYLLTINDDPHSGQYLEHDYGTMIRAQGDFRWHFESSDRERKPDFVQYYIRE